MKNEGKKILSLLLVLAMVLSFAPVSFADEVQQEAPAQSSDSGKQGGGGDAQAAGGSNAGGDSTASAGGSSGESGASSGGSAGASSAGAGSGESGAASAGSAEASSAGAGSGNSGASSAGSAGAPSAGAGSGDSGASSDGSAGASSAGGGSGDSGASSAGSAGASSAGDGSAQPASSDSVDSGSDSQSGGNSSVNTGSVAADASSGQENASGFDASSGKEDSSDADTASGTESVGEAGTRSVPKDTEEASGERESDSETAGDAVQAEKELGQPTENGSGDADADATSADQKAESEATSSESAEQTSKAAEKAADTVTSAAVQKKSFPKNAAQQSAPLLGAAADSYSVKKDGVEIEKTYDANGNLLIGDDVEISGSGGNIIVENQTKSITVTLKNAIVSAKNAIAGILVKANTTLKLLLSGTSSVTGGENHAGIEVEWTKEGDSPKYASLTIDGDGTLNATGGSGSGGAGIGGSKGEKGVYGDITINGGTINATGTKESAGIGSSDNPMNGTSTGSYKHIEDRWGTITINGGNVTATGHARGAGIGGGNHSDSGLIVINDGTVTANGHSGIGSGYGSSQTESLTVLKKGPGYYYGDITINGGTIVATATSDGTTDAGGAGIGGGMYSDAKITINGGNITATGGNGLGLNSFHHGGSGIGGGYEGHAEVTINGGTVTAIGGGAASGIGSGSIPNKNPDNNGSKGYKSRMGETTVEKTNVNITGGTVTATGGVSGGAGIGGGVGADNISVSITGGNVTATGALSNRDPENKGMRGGAGIGSGYSGTNSGESAKYFDTTNVDITIGGDANVVATGGWGAAGIGSGAVNKTAESIDIDVNDAQVRAFSDGTKFAIDSRDGEADIDVAGDLLQATFVFPYDDGGMKQDPTGLKTIIVTNDKTGETFQIITPKEQNQFGMLDGYRSFATTVSEAGNYTVYTDEKSIGQGGGRYFGKGETEVRDPARPLSEMTRYTVTNGELSDNHFLFPVKSVVVTKVVVAEGGLDKSQINTTCYFALWDRSKGEYVQRDGKTWIESIDIVGGVPQSRAIFADVNDSPEGGYGIWEVDKNGRDEGIIGMTFGSYELRLVETRHGDAGDNDAEIDDDNWTDEVSVINTYFPVPDPDPTPDPTPVPVGPGGPVPEEIDEDEVPLAAGSLTNQLGECFD